LEVAPRIAVWALAGSAFSGSALALAFQLAGLGHLATALSVAAAAIGAAIGGFAGAYRFARHVDAAARFLEQRLAATEAVVRREAETSQRERALAADLARKSEELEQRLRERALLFDVLRESASSHDLDSVLRLLVEQLGPAMRFREAAVLLREADERLTIRAAWGFSDPRAVLGRSIRIGEGLTGEAAAQGATVRVADVSQAPAYLAFWGQVPRTGSFLTVPIRAKQTLIGMFAFTRAPGDPLTEIEIRYLEAMADQAALAIHNAQLFAELEARSTHDALTGLPNRRLFDDRIATAIAEAERFGHALSVLAIDIDHFKQINDLHGHQVGDEALVAVARTLARGVRAVDTVARIGGEEFAIILSRADLAEAARIAEKLRREVAALTLRGAGDQPLGHLSISVGVAQWRRGESAGSLLGRADAALYDAKRSGRNRISTVPPAA
jgi:diguanylate cyclase (GGDEF)-like protein